jgi:hypothetical protein
MGAFYGNKIVNKEINAKTGKAWTIKDVPAFWKAKTENWLKENQNKK